MFFVFDVDVFKFSLLNSIQIKFLNHHLRKTFLKLLLNIHLGVYMGQVEGFFKLNSPWLVKEIPDIQHNPH